MKIILASASAGRKKLLKGLGLKFEVMPANIAEEEFTATTPLGLVKKIAKAKAIKVLSALRSVPALACGTKNTPFRSSLGRHTPRALSQDYLIIAADSMVLFGGQTYGKPRTKAEAKKILKMLSGKTHEFLSGLYIINTKNNLRYQKSCKSRVVFENLTPKEIGDYVKKAAVTSFAGGYAPDLVGGEILKAKMKIIGSKSNVLGGLPLEKLLPILKENNLL